MSKTFSVIKISSFLMILFVLFSGLSRTNAQSQALNGQIEGIVKDAAGAVIPNASVTLRNTDTGTERKINSDENGFYRALLLPLGNYQLTVEAPNFKRLVREGVTLTTGQTAMRVWSAPSG